MVWCDYVHSCLFVFRFSRTLEESLLQILSQEYDIQNTSRSPINPGVWITKAAPQHQSADSATAESATSSPTPSSLKIAALGITASRWVTMHGMAINIDDRPLPFFNQITPCGLSRDLAGVCTLNQVLTWKGNANSNPATLLPTFAQQWVKSLAEVFHLDVQRVRSPEEVLRRQLASVPEEVRSQWRLNRVLELR